MGNFKEAITDYTTLLQLQPNDITYLYKRAILYDKNHISENSLIDITKAINKNKNSYRDYDKYDMFLYRFFLFFCLCSALFITFY
jgi:tetratricopeptide (TPR) repeat protein